MSGIKKENYFKGKVKLDKRTKNLSKRIQAGDIALIDHVDIDEMAGYSLARNNIKAVLNINSSISGKYPNLGPKILIDHGIYVLDEVDKEIWEMVSDGVELEIHGDQVLMNGKTIASGSVLTRDKIKEKIEEASLNLDQEIENFVQNTLEIAQKEKDLITGEVKVPEVGTTIRGRHSLVVVRGHCYREDLKTILSYVKEVKPVIIAVDGGADAVREFGLKPDIIIGDMDSVSDETLMMGAEIIVHAYSNGDAPGLERIEKLGLNAKVFPSPGTSEDIAMLLAYEKGSEIIVAVGTHSNVIDFFEKGRKGMASTLLVRLRVGNRLIDARGVSQLYRGKVKISLMLSLLAAAFIPVFVLASYSPKIQHIIYLIFLKIRLVTGGG
ncbi:putative cytokinetic ring protein SteA [Candidatus Contubernalis alkaliaceticus]|uniref:putative cytokinetic ring protein SteA n=1 Tax=Candidatus Contubernalis alkaliaceticus TaxID=338645 RepID=UPI001F4BCE43|nr:putative cytokinetic ring protein SteA [Candidatus Contubernalis alkalaceticus]UNC92535.1 hypothetical protein HUE98_10755 [Candidatus Contubernalis alkalaceticus]